MAMNLGSSVLKSVNSNKPQLLHSNSKRSITASDDYYSLSDHSSAPSSGEEERATVVRYQTPPSRLRSERLEQDDGPLLRLESPIQPQQQSATPTSPIKVTTFDDDEIIPRKPVTAYTMSNWTSAGRSEVSPPTPGIDDTPYIQFAIDQLTRDEELLGRSRNAPRSGAVSPISEGEELRHSRILENNDNVTESSRQVEAPPRQDSVSPITPDGVVLNNVFIPAQPPVDNFRYPPLNFVPVALRLLPIGILTFCCVLMVVGLIIAFVWALKYDGLLAYDGISTSRYFLFEFLPQLLASIIIVWLMAVQSALQRVLPFILLAKDRKNGTGQSTEAKKQDEPLGVLNNVPLFLTNYLTPQLSSFRHGEYLLGTCSIVFWLSLFTIPLASSLFQTRLYQYPSGAEWMWSVVEPVAWVLITLYSFLVLALAVIPIYFANRMTGLKWDPVSLADILVLLRASNIMALEDAGAQRGSRNRHSFMGSRPASIGYWETSKRPGQVFYGIGENQAPVRQYSVRKGKTVPKEMNNDIENQDLRRPSTFESWQSDIRGQSDRYRWTPWFLKDTWVVTWLVLAIVLMIAFVVASFVNGGVETGFLPLLPAPTTDLGFSSANFLYSFLPSLIGLILYLNWKSIDTYFRALQPFANLSSKNGATAENSLLLSYPSLLPFEATIAALYHGHFKVAWFSFIGLLSMTLPVLAGGTFTAQFRSSSQSVRETAAMPAYYALVVFVIYAFSFLIIWPTKKRYLPHDISTLGNIIGHVNQSPLLRDEAFRDPRTKIDLVTRLVSVPKGETEQPRYGFGVYLGRDAKEHIGIDRLQRPGEEMMDIIRRRP